MPNIKETFKELPPFLMDIRNRLMRQLSNEGLNNQHIADIFRVTKGLVWQTLNPGQKKVEEEDKIKSP